MALQTLSVALDGTTATKTFTFAKPAAGYIKTIGLTVTPVAGDSSGAEVNFLPDVDNGDGTMTGTAKLDDPTVVGTVEIIIADTL